MMLARATRLTKPAWNGWHSTGGSLLLCGRYEGFDERVTLLLQPEEIWIGDYVLNGGEVAAMVIIDAVIRLVPGVLGDADSNRSDSFSTASTGLLEFAQYTRPREYRGLQVPEILLSGRAREIARWRGGTSRRTARAVAQRFVGGVGWRRARAKDPPELEQ